MDEWSLLDLDCPINQFDSYHYATYPSCYQAEPVPRVPHCPPPPQAHPCPPAGCSADMAMHFAPQMHYGNAAAAAAAIAKGENPREIRNRAEKMRRDRLNQSVAELAAMVPPVVAARRKIDKTTVLRLTAHYLRAHQYVFGDSIGQSAQEFNPESILKVLSLFNGFLITVTYRGIIVVVSQNVHQYLGYTELDLLGQNLLNITHESDRANLREQLMPKSQTLGPNGELMIPDEPDGTRKVEEALAQEKRKFVVRLKKLGQRSEPSKYVTCHVEGSLRKSDRACRSYSRCCQIVRRARARSENPCSSGNDIVFIGIVRPTSETFINESALESYRMEYRTRHSIDGGIIQCESRIALVTGYMTHEVSGLNAMNFMHRDDVRWVIIALREMYDQHRLFGESCYRLITKNGQLIYMRTRGCLDVDQNSRAVTSFVCTNTVVNEDEGRHLIKLMKRKFSMMVNNSESPVIEEIEDGKEDDTTDNQAAPVEDPRRLEQVILHLVTNLPSPSPQEMEDSPYAAASPEKCMSPHRLTIIPPNKERIVSAIEKIYGVMKTFHKDSDRIRCSVTEISNGKPIQNAILPSQGKQLVQYETSASLTSSIQTLESPPARTMSYNGSENDYNTKQLNIAASPDMGYFDDSPSAFTNMTSIFPNFNQNDGGNQNETQEVEAYEIQSIGSESTISMPRIHYIEESNLLQAPPQPSSSSNTCGTKRQNDFEDLDMVYKKKNTEFVRQNKQNSESDSPTLDQFFDESLFNSDQIESAISSLESMDPSFPDLLVSTDVQDILGQIEKEAEEQRLQTHDLSEYE